MGELILYAGSVVRPLASVSVRCPHSSNIFLSGTAAPIKAKFHEYQRSLSLFDLCPRSFRFLLSNIFWCEAARLIEAKFHARRLWVGEKKICSHGPGHMTKMATMLIYGKTPLKIFFSETSRPIIFELGIKHWGSGPYKVCSNDDLVLTLAYFMARTTLLSNAFSLKNS